MIEPEVEMFLRHFPTDQSAPLVRLVEPGASPGPVPAKGRRYVLAVHAEDGNWPVPDSAHAAVGPDSGTAPASALPSNSSSDQT
jgi:hypothetical protein